MADIKKGFKHKINLEKEFHPCKDRIRIKNTKQRKKKDKI